MSRNKLFMLAIVLLLLGCTGVNQNGGITSDNASKINVTGDSSHNGTFVKPSNMTEMQDSGISKGDETLEIHFLNVSQGDSEFIIAGNRTMLVDCGPSDMGNRISNYLIDRRVYALDYLVITHTDADHIGGCAKVLQNLNVRKVLMDGQVRTTKSYLDAVALIPNGSLVIAKKYDEYLLDSARIMVLHANTGSSEPNQDSIVFMLYYGNFTALMDADCDTDCETSLLNENIDADVLKAPHHGSRYGTSSAFLNKVTPQLGVIEVGKNDYGHPANETLQRLAAAGVMVLRTDLNGTVVLKTNGTAYSVSAG